MKKTWQGCNVFFKEALGLCAVVKSQLFPAHFKSTKSKPPHGTFWGAWDFFGPIKWYERQRGPFLGPKKSRAPQKVEILCKGPFRILEMAPVSDFQGLFSHCPATFSAQLHWYFWFSPPPCLLNVQGSFEIKPFSWSALCPSKWHKNSNVISKQFCFIVDLIYPLEALGSKKIGSCEIWEQKSFWVPVSWNVKKFLEFSSSFYTAILSMDWNRIIWNLLRSSLYIIWQNK